MYSDAQSRAPPPSTAQSDAVGPVHVSHAALHELHCLLAVRVQACDSCSLDAHVWHASQLPLLSKKPAAQSRPEPPPRSAQSVAAEPVHVAHTALHDEHVRSPAFVHADVSYCNEVHVWHAAHVSDES